MINQPVLRAFSPYLFVHLSLLICHMINTHRDTARTHRCLVGLVCSYSVAFLFLIIYLSFILKPFPFLFLLLSVCDQMAKGIFAFYGITTGETYSVASSYSKSLHMPFINPNYPRNISRIPYDKKVCLNDFHG